MVMWVGYAVHKEHGANKYLKELPTTMAVILI